MSGGPPPVVVAHSAAWAPVSADDDIAAWAVSTAGRLWSLSGQPHASCDVEVLASSLELVALSAFVVPCSGAFVLCPEPARGPRAVLRLSALRHPAGTEVQRIVDDVLLPAEQQVLPPEVRHVDGPGLRHVRIRQRAWAERGTVADHICSVHPFEEGAWLMSAAVPDLREVARWLPHVDELVAGLQLQVPA